MKVSYIIMPFENAEYLIRCVNSLYRQLGEDYEVILAENELDEKSIEFLNEKPQVKRISETPKAEEEKLSEAVSLLSGDCVYVQLLDVNTVISPVMTKSVLTCGEFDLIVPAIAIRNSDKFVLDEPKISNVIKNLENCTIERFCLKKEAAEELINKNINLVSFVLLKCVENASFGIVADVCMYVEEQTEKDRKSFIDTSVISEIICGINKVENAEIRFRTADTLIGMLVENDTYSGLRELAGKCTNDLLLSRLFEERLGCSTDDFVKLDDTGYSLYKALVKNDANTSEIRQKAGETKQLSEISKSLESLKKDMAVLKARPAMSVVQTAPAMLDPSVEVPKMYYEGRLGFKTIWRSFCGWLKFKFGGKK